MTSFTASSPSFCSCSDAAIHCSTSFSSRSISSSFCARAALCDAIRSADDTSEEMAVACLRASSSWTCSFWRASASRAAFVSASWMALLRRVTSSVNLPTMSVFSCASLACSRAAFNSAISAETSWRALASSSLFSATFSFKSWFSALLASSEAVSSAARSSRARTAMACCSFMLSSCALCAVACASSCCCWACVVRSPSERAPSSRACHCTASPRICSISTCVVASCDCRSATLLSYEAAISRCCAAAAVDASCAAAASFCSASIASFWLAISAVASFSALLLPLSALLFSSSCACRPAISAFRCETCSSNSCRMRLSSSPLAAPS
mmetsp:Transcript_10739/g.27160  ORF Transcript_10739/g.27160 Transcript_10739/m.27160 type:complete len:327 (-) Transcript_10739:1907-2887(-)